MKIDAIKERLNRLIDITESGQMNREAITEFLTHGPSDLLHLLTLTDRYETALRDIIEQTGPVETFAVDRAKQALEQQPEDLGADSV